MAESLQASLRMAVNRVPIFLSLAPFYELPASANEVEGSKEEDNEIDIFIEVPRRTSYSGRIPEFQSLDGKFQTDS